MRFISNTKRRPCTKCGLAVRAGEGQLASKSKSGEWLVKHSSNCPEFNPVTTPEGDRSEALHADVERITPANGPRIYRIKNFGDFQSVTTVLDRMSSLEEGPDYLSEWARVESGHAAIQNMDLYSKDYKAWNSLVKYAGDSVANEAALFGTSVHDSLEDIVLCRIGDINPDINEIVESHTPKDEHMRERYLERIHSHIEQFLIWEQSWVGKWYGAELIVWHTGEKWAGAVDAYGAIAEAELGSDGEWHPTDTAVSTFIDWKTSQPKSKRFRSIPGKLTKNSYRLQVAGAYARAEYTFNTQGKLTKFADRKPIQQAMIAHVGLEEMLIEPIVRAEFDKYGEAFRKMQEINGLISNFQEMIS